METFGQFKICVQKELPDTQNQLKSLRMKSRSLNDYKKLKAAFYEGKEWPVGSRIRIYIGSPPSNIQIIKYPSRPIYDRNGNLIKLDPLQTIVNSSSFTYKNIVDMIKRVFNERFKPIVNLNFEFVTDMNNSDIRISFDLSTGSWSYLGTDCKYIQKNRATMNFGWFEIAVVLHEFGHAFGAMIHEHQSPLGEPIKWNMPEVYKWAQSTQGWNVEQTNSQIIDKYDTNEINGSVFDPKSIMLYFYPSYLTLDNKGTSLNARLSPEDTIYLNLKYPGSLQTPQQFYSNTYGENILAETSTTTLIPSTTFTTTTLIPSTTFTKIPSTTFTPTTLIPTTTSTSTKNPTAISTTTLIPSTTFTPTTLIPTTTSTSTKNPAAISTTTLIPATTFTKIPSTTFTPTTLIPTTTSTSTKNPAAISTTTLIPTTTSTPAKKFNKLYTIVLFISIPIITLFLLLIFL
jgi:hypothetical protein